MPKQRKGPPPDELVQLRAVLASNLRAYMTVTYGSGRAITSVAEEVGRSTGLGKNTVLRALRETDDDVDVRLDTLVRLASHFGASARDLLLDYGSVRATAGRVPAATNKNNRARIEGTSNSEDDRAALQRRRRA